MTSGNGQSSPTDSNEKSSQGNGKTSKPFQSHKNTGVYSNNNNQNNSNRFEANLPGMYKDNIFVYGVNGQVERYLKSRRGLIEWVGMSKEYRNAMSIYLIKKVEPTFDEPEEPKPAKEGNAVSTAQMERYKMKLRRSLDDSDEWTESKGRLFRTTITLCSRPLKNKLESNDKYQDLVDNHDVNGLLDLIKEVVYSTDESQEPVWIIANTMVKLHNTRQQEFESDSNFYKRLESQIEVAESVWGPLIPSIMKGKAVKLQEQTRQAYLSRLFLHNLHKRHHDDIEDLGKAYTDGNNNYPKTMEAALAWVTNRRDTTTRQKHKTPTANASTDPNTQNLRSFHQQEVKSESDNQQQQQPQDDSSNGARFSGFQRRRNVSGRPILGDSSVKFFIQK